MTYTPARSPRATSPASVMLSISSARSFLPTITTFRSNCAGHASRPGTDHPCDPSRRSAVAGFVPRCARSNRSHARRQVFPDALSRPEPLRRPPVPPITSPASGLAASSVWNAVYSSSVNSSCICRVKTRVSTKITLRFHISGVCTSTAYQLSCASLVDGVPDGHRSTLSRRQTGSRKLPLLAPRLGTTGCSSCIALNPR